MQLQAPVFLRYSSPCAMVACVAMPHISIDDSSACLSDPNKLGASFGPAVDSMIRNSITTVMADTTDVSADLLPSGASQCHVGDVVIEEEIQSISILPLKDITITESNENEVYCAKSNASHNGEQSEERTIQQEIGEFETKVPVLQEVLSTLSNPQHCAVEGSGLKHTNVPTNENEEGRDDQTPAAVLDLIMTPSVEKNVSLNESDELGGAKKEEENFQVESLVRKDGEVLLGEQAPLHEVPENCDEKIEVPGAEKEFLHSVDSMASTHIQSDSSSETIFEADSHGHGPDSEEVVSSNSALAPTNAAAEIQCSAQLSRPAQKSESLIQFTGLNHVAFCCESLERSLDFYCGLLGLKRNLDRPDLPYRGAWLLLGAEGIHIMEVPNPDPVKGRPAHGGWDRHACLNVKNVENLRLVFEEAGIDYQHSPVPSIFCRDPDGNGLEFIEVNDVHVV